MSRYPNARVDKAYTDSSVHTVYFRYPALYHTCSVAFTAMFALSLARCAAFVQKKKRKYLSTCYATPPQIRSQGNCRITTLIIFSYHSRLPWYLDTIFKVSHFFLHLYTWVMVIVLTFSQFF